MIEKPKKKLFFGQKGEEMKSGVPAKKIIKKSLNKRLAQISLLGKLGQIMLIEKQCPTIILVARGRARAKVVPPIQK